MQSKTIWIRSAIFAILVGHLSVDTTVLFAQSDSATPTKTDRSAVVDPEIRDFFERFQETTRKESADELVSLLDIEYICEQSLLKADVEIPDFFRTQMPTIIKQQFQHWFELADDRWSRHEIVYANIAEDGNHAEVLVRTWDQDYTTTRTFFDLRRTDQWRIADWTDLSLGLSSQWMMASVLRDGFNSDQPEHFQRVSKMVVEAITALAQNDLSGSATALRQLMGQDIPQGMRTLRWCFCSAVELHADATYALECVDKLEAYEPQSLFKELVRCNAYLELEQYELVIEEGQRFLNRFGADADAFYSIGLAYKNLGNTEKALEYFVAGLDDTPEAYALVESFALTLPEDRKNEFVERFERIPDYSDYAETLADAFEIENDIAALRTLIEYVENSPTELPNQPYYHALVLIHDKQFEDAIGRLIQGRSVLDEDDYYLDYYNDLICDTAIAMGDPLRAYELIDPATDAFTLLLDKLEILAQSDDATDEPAMDFQSQIETLIQTQTERYPDEVDTWNTLGYREITAENYEKAKQHYEKALELFEKQTANQGPEENNDYDEYLEEALFSNLAICHEELGTLVDFYNAAEDKPFVYDMIAYNADYEGQQFQTIDELYRKEFPSPIDEIKQQIAEKAFEKALEICDQHVADETSDYAFEALIFKVVCLAHLERFDDAILAARQLADEDRDFGRAIVYAIKNDRERFAAAFRLAAQAGYGPLILKEYIDVPDDWDFIDEIQPAADQEFNQFFEVRRIVLLLSEPFDINAYSVHRAASSLGMDLPTVQPDSLTERADEEDYLCEFPNGAVILAHQQSEYFINSGRGHYRGDPKNLVYHQFDTEVTNLIDSHQGWIAIDIYQWPQADDADVTTAIPDDCVKLIADLGRELANGNAIAAIHEDSASILAPLPPTFFDDLIEQKSYTAFKEAVTETVEPNVSQ
ncbi:tetratricopeptide repeat protein [Rhodopirellula sp. MGV]|uniref:tetratricopeptide repeat protein n=1 Tax=Rhodopirellula sp. MGV TaxID=2023130 RepID=UPI000B96C411|nr:tetratricopeptide repeat protein [Rhodopirellula sp. MGV]OYP37625.1 hypothetical protein CGZ80_04745 [Rhodopirellula sp. MGV]PNY34943.1 tetratricopeptide repeat protein [Rhodopirellula baltica]